MSKWALIVYMGTTASFGQIYDSEQDCRRYLGVGLPGERIVCVRQGSGEIIEQEKKRKVPADAHVIIMVPEKTGGEHKSQYRSRSR